jgi:hypothetical protein
VESDLPQNEWPEWIVPSMRIFSVKRDTTPDQEHTSHLFTGPDKTRLCATIADWLLRRFDNFRSYKISRALAAKVAIETMIEVGVVTLGSAKEKEKQVATVVRAMVKLANNEISPITYTPAWDIMAYRKLLELKPQ